MRYLIKQVTILDQDSKHHGKKRDLLLVDGVIQQIAAKLEDKKATTIQGKDLYVSCGWCDLFSDFSEPGFEQHETLTSGKEAAAAGGFTQVCLLPDLKPLTQSKSTVEFLRSKSSLVELLPIGCISQQQEGKNLAEMFDMHQAGAVAFSDGRKPVQHHGLLLKALQYVKSFDGLVIEIPDDLSLSQHGLMHEGVVSTQLGIAGKPSIAESLAVQQAIELVEYTQSKIHLTGISCKESVDKIRQAKKKKVAITCSTTIHHVLYTDHDLSTYNSIFKIHPPLRTAQDQQALIKGLEDGTIDAIASHHTPCNWDSKQIEFEDAKAGMIALQTMLPLLLRVNTKLDLHERIDLISSNPRRILGKPKSTINEQQPAQLTVFSTSKTWQYNESTNFSLSQNSPVFGEELTGKVVAVFNRGEGRIYE
ncbi:MAG: dihydroorotase [Chitinophagaceae bacterium]|nr:dihydroorotase [Chitinophagaceae bacterium]